MKVELDENLIPEGYRFLKIGPTQSGDLVISGDQVIEVSPSGGFWDPKTPRLIVEKIVPIWRLLELGERIKEGDEVWDSQYKTWGLSRSIGTIYRHPKYIYRRKINETN